MQELFLDLGKESGKRGMEGACVMYVYVDLEMYSLKKYLKKLNRMSS